MISHTLDNRKLFHFNYNTGNLFTNRGRNKFYMRLCFFALKFYLKKYRYFLKKSFGWFNDCFDCTMNCKSSSYKLLISLLPCNDTTKSYEIYKSFIISHVIFNAPAIFRHVIKFSTYEKLFCF